jgi:ketosteroid isomerase-like protein
MNPTHALRGAASALALVAALGLAGCVAVVAPEGVTRADEAERARVTQQLEQLLQRYAANDVDGVLALLDGEFIVYGSDAAELVRTPQQLRQLMQDDFALWRTAKFGHLRDLDLRVNGSLATAYFHVPFSAGGRAPLTVRFSTTWRKTGGEWRLAQSANTVPTTGQSAAALLQAR